ncbi:hypothetical protein BGZ96_006065 [Linnemannia gamsii]|uniref:F-box domain-containing protein n=1 Tax=Linnemannia gamsii TaxID=64522 RepID=A0ABQ7K3M7_9FUNG|nr:hypothetical protein BGZ96_006065 [Linnemannia gamsii]
MGLDTPDSLAQQYVAALTLATTEPPHQPRSSLWKVFSIPELIDAIARYLNTSQLLKLGLLNKTLSYIFQPQLSLSLFTGAFHDPPFGPPGTSLILPDTFRRLAPRVNALSLDLLSFQECMGQRIMLEILYEHSAMALHCLRIAYWGEDLGVLEEILTQLPNLTDLSVTFKSSCDATAFPKVLIKVGRARQIAVAAVGDVQPQHQGGLKTLAIALGIPKVMTMEMTVLSELVQVWPDLASLELACISLTTDSPAFLPSTAYNTPPPPPPPPPIAVPVPPQAVAAIAATTTAPLPLSAAPPSQPVDSLEGPSFPRMKSLTLTECTLKPLSFRALDRLFPSLQELELNSCPGGWYRTLAGVRTSQIGSHSNFDLDPNVPFLYLRRLNIWDKVQSARNNIVGIVKSRPYLTCIGTDMLPDSRDGLLEMAAFCSGVEVNDLVAGPGPPSALPSTLAPDPSTTPNTGVGVNASAGVNSIEGASTTANEEAVGTNASEVAVVNASNIAIVSVGAGPNATTDASTPMEDMSKVRNRIKRLALQTYASPPHDMETIERFYNAPAFRHLDYVYIQNRELSMKMFPFANTLRELNLGGPESVLRKSEVKTLNLILHQLPSLEVLKLDRYVHNAALSKLFQGFGPELEYPLPWDESQMVDTRSGGGQKEGSISCLRRVRLFYQGFGNEHLPLRGLEIAVLDRLMFLEKLTVKAWSEKDLPKKEVIDSWQKNVLLRETTMVGGDDGGDDGGDAEGDAGGEREGSLSSPSSVTKCRIMFKVQSQKIISVAL